MLTIVLHRPARRNAVDGPTARALHAAMVAAEADSSVDVIVLYGAGGVFCAGADLMAMGSLTAESGRVSTANPLTPVQLTHESEPAHPSRMLAQTSSEPSSSSPPSQVLAHTSDIGPMGLSRLELTKPVLAAIAGPAVAGGLELACWADLRLCESDSILGVFCRRFGVPLIDGGTVRLPNLIGLSRAMDLILTGRGVSAQEALSMGLVNRVVAVGTVREAAESLALDLCAFPQLCMRADRWSAIHGQGKSERRALADEFNVAMSVLSKESIAAGASKFAQGAGRHGQVATANTPAAAAETASSPHNGRYSCVLFDLGGVVVDSPVAEILRYERSLNLPAQSLNLLLGRSAHFHALERGELDLAGFAPLLEAEALARGVKIDATKLFALMSSVAIRAPMARAIARLRAAGLIVGAVTNNWRNSRSDQRGVMMTAQVDSLFDFVVESALVGVRKPDPSIFAIALEKCTETRRKSKGASGSSVTAPVQPQLPPSSVLFLDDLGTNLKSARSLGFETIKVTAEYGRALHELQSKTGAQMDDLIAEIGSVDPATATPIGSKL